MRHNSDQEQINIEKLCHFTAKQNEAWAAARKHKFVLYGGAMGGGKSYWLRWQLVLLLFTYALKGHRHVTVGLFCEDYRSLEDRHISKIKYEFPAWLGKYNESDHTFRLKEVYGDGVIAFRNLNDVSKYQSSEFAAIAVDELTKNKEIDFMFLRTRLRWPGIDHAKFIAATNPGGVGHAWVKKLWIDREYPPNEKEGDQFAYIPALVADNPHLPESYRKNDLASLPDDEKRAWLEGDWDLFEGQYFTEFRRDFHVIEPYQLPSDIKIFVAIDYGYLAPSAALWCYIDSEGILTVYQELYRSGLTYAELAKEIVAMTPPYANVRYWAIDPSLENRGGETGKSGADLMRDAYREASGRLVSIRPANNERVTGWNVVRTYLKSIPVGSRTVSKIRIFTTCVNLIRTLPTLVHDPEKPEDLDTRGEDHAADALRYAVMSDPPKSPPTTITLPTIGDRLSRMLNNRSNPPPYKKRQPCDDYD